VGARSAHSPQRKDLTPKGDNTVTATDAATSSIDVLSTLALRGVLLEIADEFRALTRLSFTATYKSTNMILNLIAEGATADMTIITREAIDRLVRDGILVAGSTADLAQSGVGIAVRAGAPKPDISTVAALRRTLLETKSIAFTRLGASGVHFAQVIERLGIADEVRRKAHIGDAYIGEVVARGEAEMAVQQISELMPVKGIDIVGPLPEEMQKISVFAAGIFRSARNPDGAGKLLAHLADPRIAPVLIRKGLEPVSSTAL
jgi:molybdate transport system substrate-binding protein